MIVYDLQCSRGHLFEGWFKDSLSYEKQMEEALVSCPICKDRVVTKVPSTFAVKPSRSTHKPAASGEETERLGRQLMDFVDRNFEDVGCDFAKEALKIHYGAVKPRNIRGSSTSDEERTLKEEGVRFFKFPLDSSRDPSSDLDS
ncbi:DUF1178 family protein [Desulfococcus multivorans]|jgi:hypothetical protein|uniref:DUF1178 domain-containing protein n=2 Tax=Desulfococcus TaxID=896 RepID=S7TXZ9_DESML|nr:DUF1178 family protein [Desulfococcus multivorans]AOY57368.1 conserved uncharacterized protein, DUF1178 [Desulfococcus multivorans]AQU99813.1 hypothetical protein B2D07_02835 [Desulfococcus multivorans]EPR41996.1 protein of unknown function DUF1178 [Desulfococcus multivorans DSM 2059]MDX9817695.1 DUF1178 family protein [Desulfococcus multivorans]SKA10581.1 hypothetical protein SAMN02745446_02793 [Desulfococcus multivorans DSM 2059]